jgi:hypothetical protein
MPYHSTKKQMVRTPTKTNTLTKTQEQQLKNASKNHTKKHIEYMRKLMKEGLTFNQSHKKALKDIGK